MAVQDKLKVGIFGVGHLGKFHVNNWLQIEEAEITGFYDPNEEQAAFAIKEYGIKRYTNMDQLIEDSQAIDIIAPTNIHYEIASKALRKSRHVFVEKPLAATMGEAREIVQLAKEARVKVQVGHVERFNPAYLAAMQYTQQPMFVEVHRLAQFNPRGTEVSVILDLMIHDIDILLSLVKSPVKNIYASGVAVMTDTPDIANVRIEFNNGCVANLTSSRISMKKMRKIRIFQKDAYIGIDLLAKKTEIIKLKELSDKDVFSFDLETPKGIKTIAIANPGIKENNAIKMELESFVSSILSDKQTAVSEVDGFLAMEVAHLILEKISSTSILEK
jgi:predicted dehydrogenase